jgi:hypothetical protein
MQAKARYLSGEIAEIGKGRLAHHGPLRLAAAH